MHMDERIALALEEIARLLKLSLEQNTPKPRSTQKSTQLRRAGDDILAVFEHWKRRTGYTRAMLDDKRRELIATALRNHTIEECQMVVDGYLKSPMHCGENERGARYLSLELMFRSAKHIEAGLEFFVRPPKPKGTTGKVSNWSALPEDQYGEVKL